MSRQQGTGLPGAKQGPGDQEIGRKSDDSQIDQKLTDEWKSRLGQDGAGEPRLREDGEIDDTEPG